MNREATRDNDEADKSVRRIGVHAPAATAVTFSQLSRDDSVAVRIATEIVSAIAAGGYPPGSRLPTEQELAAQFGVSRPSVREALSALQFAGYVTSRRGYGSVVVADKPSPPGPYSGLVAAGANVEGIDVIEERLIVEVEATRLAALDPDPGALTEAMRILHGMDVAVRQPSLGAESDLNLHLALVNICKNRALGEAAAHLIELTAVPSWQRFRKKAWRQPKLLDEWVAHHGDILDAVARRDPEAAARYSTLHLLSVIADALGSDDISARDRRRLKSLAARYSDAI